MTYKNIKTKKIRKQRSRNNYDLCRGCGFPNCDPMLNTHNPSMNKIQSRKHQGLCMGCGKPLDDCTCKSGYNY